MNKILPTVIAFFSLKINKLNKRVLQFSQINNAALSQNEELQNRKRLSKSFVYSFVFLFTVSFANATNYYSKSTGNLNSTATWGVATDGTGTAPANFTSGDVFYIRNNTTPTIGASWTVSGASSKIVLGDGTIACNFTVGSNYVLTANLDISSNGTLTLTTTGATAVTFGTLATNSTVNYAQAGSQTILAGAYVNLTLSGSGTKTFAVASSVTNNLTLSGTATATTTANLSIGGNLDVGSGTTLTTGSNFTLGVTGTTAVTGTLTLANTGAKTFTGNVTVNSGGVWSETGVAAIGFGGNLTNSGTYTASANTTGAHTFSGSSKTISGSGVTSTINIPVVAVSGTYTNNGDLYIATLSGAGSLTNASTLGISANSSITILANSGTATINGSGTISTSLANFTNTGTLHLSGTGTIAGITNSTGGIVYLNSSGTISSFNNTTPTSVLNISATTVPTITTLTATTAGNTVNYTGTSQTVKGTTYSNLILSGSGTKTLGASTIITGNLSVNNSITFATSNNSLTLGGNFTNSGTFTPGSSSITMNGTAAQSIAGFSTTGAVLDSNTAGAVTFTSAMTTTGILTLVTGAVLNLNTITTHTTGALVLNGVNQVGGTWGTTTSGAANPNNTYFIGTGRITVPNNSLIDNDFASYGTTGDVAGRIGEYGGAFTLTAPVGSILMNVKFASYGTPTGTSPNFVLGSCHATSSKLNTINLLGNTSWSFNATNGVLNGIFGDPCVGTSKTYSVVATYTQPICATSAPAITINGSTPTGGNGTYNYLWEMSTTSATSGYATASGTSNGRDYLVPAGISQTRWYRRTITSGTYTSNTIVILQVNNAPSLSSPTAATISGTTTICAGASTTLTVSGGSLSGDITSTADKGGYAEWFTGSCGGTSIGTGNSITVSPASTTTYYVRYTNSCGSTATCLSQGVTVNASLSAVVVTPNGVQTICTTGTGSLLTAAETGGGTITSRQWGKRLVSGGAITTIAGQTAVSYTPTGAGLTAGTWFIVCTSTPTCGSAIISNEVRVTVNANVTPSVTIAITSGSNPACNGSSVTFTATPINGGIPNYQWTKNGTNIGGATSVTYTGVAGTDFVSTDIIRCVLTPTTICVSPTTATSTGITMTVTATASAGTVTAGTSPQCIGGTTIYTVAGQVLGGGTGGWTSDNIAIATVVSGTGVVTAVSAGTCNIIYTVTGGCGGTPTASKPYTVTATANAGTVTAGTSPQCIGGTTTYTVSGQVLGGGTGGWTSDNTAIATVAAGTGVVTAVSAGTCNIVYTVTGGCGGTQSASKPYTVNPLPSTPTATATTQPTCVNSKGIITVTAPTGMNYSIDGTDYTNTNGIFNNVAVGAYMVTAKNGSGCISLATAPISINAPITNIWNGIVWSKTGSTTPPISTDIVVFDAGFTITTPLNACSCQINSGVDIVVGVVGGTNDTAILKIENGLTVDPTGSLTFENNASLVQVNDAGVNSGEIIYKRDTNAMKNFDYTHWTSPVQDQVLNVLSPYTLWDKYFSYANSAWVTEAGGNKMNPAGKGFIIRVPKPGIAIPAWTGLTYIQKVAFKGKPNNGAITIASQGTLQYNLIGNPYPSAMDVDLFITNVNNSNLINGSLYFWTHNTSISPSGSSYVYNSNDYAVYNLTGGTAGAPTGGAAPSGEVASGVAFFVESTGAGNFEFNNSMRLSSSASNSQFFRQSKTKKSAGIEKNRVWLNLRSSGGIFKQLLVGYIAGASNDFDKLYDGATFDSNSYADFYSVNKSDKLAIQGRSLPFDKKDRVPLGYRTTIAGTLEISIANVDGVMTNQTVYIEDNVTNTVHNLKNGPYSFTTSKGTFDDRFVLVYADKTLAPTLGNPDYNKENTGVVVSVKNHIIKINSFEETISKVMVYDLRGRLVYENNRVDSNQCIIQQLNSSDQFLIVVTQLVNGKWVTKEIVF